MSLLSFLLSSCCFLFGFPMRARSLMCSDDGRKESSSSSKRSDQPSGRSNRNCCCSHPSFKKRPKGKRVCVSHGARVKRCQEVEGCDNKQTVNSGVCVAHGAKVRQCTVENCVKAAVNSGCCIAHGARVTRCSVEGCQRYDAQSKGLCSIRHGGRLKRRCVVTGCNRFAKTHGK